MDPNLLAVYEDAFLALDWAVEADEAGDVAEAAQLRNVASMVAAAVLPDAADLQLGTANADSLNGGAGGDCIIGGGGNDTINGGAGADICIGGPGTDTFLNCATAYP